MALIYILSGPVNSGKSSRLEKWINRQKSIAGIIAPKINGLRYLQDIDSGERKCLELQGGKRDDTERIGRYVFSRLVFQWAVNNMKTAFHSKPEWLIIDEIGPLEISGKGLASAVNMILRSEYDGKIVLVVRESMVIKVIMHYQLDKRNIHKFKP